LYTPSVRFSAKQFMRGESRGKMRGCIKYEGGIWQTFIPITLVFQDLRYSTSTQCVLSKSPLDGVISCAISPNFQQFANGKKNFTRKVRALICYNHTRFPNFRTISSTKALATVIVLRCSIDVTNVYLKRSS
jgi:hypothetical protein